MSLSASEHCGLARRQVLALGALVPAAVALLGGCSLASGTQLTSKVTHEKVSLSDVASQVAIIDLPEPGGPTIIRLCEPAAATSKARLTFS